MTHTADKITDEPHLIETCSGGKFIVFDGLDCRITINGEGALDAASEIKKCVNMHDELVEALKDCAEAFNLHAEQYPHMVKGYTLDAFNAAYETLKKAGAL